MSVAFNSKNCKGIASLYIFNSIFRLLTGAFWINPSWWVPVLNNSLQIQILSPIVIWMAIDGGQPTLYGFNIDFYPDLQNGETSFNHRCFRALWTWEQSLKSEQQIFKLSICKIVSMVYAYFQLIHILVVPLAFFSLHVIKIVLWMFLYVGSVSKIDVIVRLGRGNLVPIVTLKIVLPYLFRLKSESWVKP